MEIRVEIGHNVRHWTTLAVTDPSPDEVAVLMGEKDEEILALLEHLDGQGRLAWRGETHDDNATYFTEGDEPAVIDVESDEED